MIETINLSPNLEQFFTILYGRRRVKYNIRYNDFYSYWFFDLVDADTDEEILMGKALIPNVNAFFSHSYLGFGKLILLDTDPNSITPLDPKTDLGTRLKLVRDFDG